MKSTAPSFIASTASGTSPWPVITITGSRDSVLLQPAQQLEPAHLRHAHIGDDAAGLDAPDSVRRKARPRCVDLRPRSGAAEQERQRIAHGFVVVDHVHRRAQSPSSDSSLLTAPKGETEDGAAAGVRLDPDPAAMRFDDRAARSTGRRPCPSRLVVTNGWNSWSAISGAIPGPVSATLTIAMSASPRVVAIVSSRRSDCRPSPRSRCGSD